ncbi:MAG TPA: MBL fold metallo-hydrolase [Ktedonobacteraceae bacterium]
MSTPSSAALREVSDLSPDPRVRIFRRTLADFDGMEVDAYVVLGSTHVVLLDTLTCPEDLAQVMATIEPHLADRQLLCINSHADWDHCWGNGYLKHRRSYVPLLAHVDCRQRLISAEALAELADYQRQSALFHAVTLVPPTLTFHEQLTISAGDLTIELLHTPGHCRDHIAAWLPELHLLLAFDTLEHPLPGIADSSCVPQMFSTLHSLLQLNAQYVLCSHSHSISPALLSNNLTYLNEIERRAHLLLGQRIPTTAELPSAVRLIDYPFEEVIAYLSAAEQKAIDQTYYSQTHARNAQAILAYLCSLQGRDELNT